MNKRSFALIMATAALVLCLLSPFAGAVTIGYTADSGGESVSINENYDVDNSVTVKESTDISFGNLQVDQERTAEGTGEADLGQTITGKTADGAQYTAENDILSEGTIDAKTYTSATGNTLGVAQTVSATGNAALLLEGEEGDNMAAHVAVVNNGRLNSKQTLDIGNSVRASLAASIWGHFGAGAAGSWAEDADGNWADTWVEMKKGELITVQGAEADGSATADQVSNVDAKRGFAGSWARDADGNGADTWVRMKNGELSTEQGAEADGSAAADQASDVDAKRGFAVSEAEDADGNWAVTEVVMRKGELITVQGAEADGSATADQASDVDAKWGFAGSAAGNADNNWAETVVQMKNGELSTEQGAEADGSAIAGQVSNVDAKRGFADSWARDADGNGAATWVRMKKGELSTVQGAEADGSAIAGQVSNVDAKRGFAVAGSVAVDADNNRAETVVEMVSGELDATLSADTSHSASASGSITAKGLVIRAIVGAVNQYGAASIENTVFLGILDFESLAIANEDEAFCSQDMSAVGFGGISKFVEADNFAGPYASYTTLAWPVLRAISTATVNETSAVVTVDP